jgi:hypothetical protein
MKVNPGTLTGWNLEVDGLLLELIANRLFILLDIVIEVIFKELVKVCDERSVVVPRLSRLRSASSETHDAVALHIIFHFHILIIILVVEKHIIAHDMTVHVFIAMFADIFTVLCRVVVVVFPENEAFWLFGRIRLALPFHCGIGSGRFRFLDRFSAQTGATPSRRFGFRRSGLFAGRCRSAACWA